jgi:sulfur carrier protein ThiS
MATFKFNLSLTASDKKDQLTFELYKPCLLTEILKELGVKKNEIGMVIVNGKWVPIEETLITNSDVIEVFPYLEGG